LDVDAELTVRNCKLTGNQAIGGDGGFDGQAIGGAIANYFGGVLSILDSTFERNRAVAGNGAFLTLDFFIADVAEGGAISNQYGAYLEISHSTFRNNQAVGGNNAESEANFPIAGGADGGAIYNAVGGVALIHDSVIEHNQAIGGNGNRANGESGLFAPPFVGYGAGGGISNTIDGAVQGFGPTQLTVLNSTIEHNEAIGGNGNTGSGNMAFVGAGLGGGIANYLGATANIENTSISHNRAVGGQGNVSSGGAAPANLGAGGGIFNALGNFEGTFEVDTGVLAPSIVNVTDSTLEHNQAQGGQGGANIPGGDGWGGAIADLFMATTNVAGSTIADNLALGGDGSAGGNGFGGGAFNDDSSSLMLTTSTVTNNHANGGDGTGGGMDGQGIGGGIYNLGLFASDALTAIAHNHASTSDDDLFGFFVLS